MQHSTRNFQRGDRKGAWCPGYGDRHDVQYADQERSTWNIQLATFNGVTERAHGARDMGTGTMSDMPLRNVQLSTFNGVTERVRGGRDMGTDTKFKQPDS